MLGLALVAAAAVVPPPAGARFDYQIGGAYPPAPSVEIVDRDRAEPPAPGRYGVCYVNAFQVQPGERGWWRRRHPRLLLRDRRERLVVDRAWREPLLDVGTATKRRALGEIVGRWTDGCARAGYRAVEPDNLDAWTRSRGQLSRRDAIAFARRLVVRAHARGLAVAQKNAPELAASGRAIGFDFAIAEECQRYRECDPYTAAYGPHVVEIEYPDAGGPAGLRAACAARGDRVSVLYRDREVRPPGRPGRVARWC